MSLRPRNTKTERKQEIYGDLANRPIIKNKSLTFPTSYNQNYIEVFTTTELKSLLGVEDIDYSSKLTVFACIGDNNASSGLAVIGCNICAYGSGSLGACVKVWLNQVFGGSFRVNFTFVLDK